MPPPPTLTLRGVVPPSPHHPTLRTRVRGGAPSQEEGGWGTESRGGRGGDGGLEPSLVSGRSSNSFQLLPHPPDFLPGTGIWLVFSLLRIKCVIQLGPWTPHFHWPSLSWHHHVPLSWPGADSASVHPGSPLGVLSLAALRQHPPRAGWAPQRRSQGEGTQTGCQAARGKEERTPDWGWKTGAQPCLPYMRWVILAETELQGFLVLFCF